MGEIDFSKGFWRVRRGRAADTRRQQEKAPPGGRTHALYARSLEVSEELREIGLALGPVSTTSTVIEVRTPARCAVEEGIAFAVLTKSYRTVVTNPTPRQIAPLAEIRLSRQYIIHPTRPGTQDRHDTADIGHVAFVRLATG